MVDEEDGTIKWALIVFDVIVVDFTSKSERACQASTTVGENSYASIL
jgi:hypothetical protein